MSEKAIAALEKLVPAPSTKNYQFYRAHYELIRDEIARLQSEVERLRGRCGDQSDLLLDLAAKIKRDGYLDKATHDAICKAVEGICDAWLLRKQAEAVDEVNRKLTKLAEDTSGLMDSKLVSQYCASVAGEHAQRLRQQAAESEDGAITRKTD